MTVSWNSERSRSFEPAIAFLLLAALSAAALLWFYLRGENLYYGDGEAHMNIARRVLDSRTPGLYQIGTAWLPIPHLLMLPFVQSDRLWRSGLAGAIPAAGCFVAAGMFLFAAARRTHGSAAAAAATLAVFALNPNLLYLQSGPMTEPMFFAPLCALIYCAVRFRETQSAFWAAATGVASAAASLTRYESWVLIPLFTMFFLLAARQRRFRMALVFGAIASVAPLLWLAHNWWYWGDALEFFRGPYSPQAIVHRTTAVGEVRYPGDHNWSGAWLYYRNDVWLCVRWSAVWLGAAGAVVAAFKRTVWPALLLAAVSVFYFASMYVGGSPIYMPNLWPHSYWNTRYGLAALPALALAAGALVTIIPGQWRLPGALLVAGLAVWPWLTSPRLQSWICWKEAQVNSEARRAWTHEAAAYLGEHYRRGSGIMIRFGDQTAVLREAGIPLRDSLNQDNGLAFDAAVARPDLFLREEWALAIAGDQVAEAMSRTQKSGPQYLCVKTIAVKGAPVIQIYRRN